MKKVNRKGIRYGRLVALKEVGRTAGGFVTWECLCDCGVKKVVSGGALQSGNAKSCGCLRDEKVREANQTHGQTKTRLYRSWDSMFQRCCNKNSINYARYGGRGITVCKEWNKSENFLRWAKNNGYNESLTLDRIDNDKDYSPSNCRWADITTQNRNKSDTVRYKGECATEASKRLGGGKSLVSLRIFYGWDMKRAFSQPVVNGVILE